MHIHIYIYTYVYTSIKHGIHGRKVLQISGGLQVTGYGHDSWPAWGLRSAWTSKVPGPHIYMYERGSFRVYFAFVLNGISHVTTPYLKYLNCLNSLEVDLNDLNYLNSQMGVLGP